MEMFYRKVGSRYKPVGYGEFPSLTPGCHLVILKGDWTHYIYNVEPDKAALVAAKDLAITKVVRIISDAKNGEIQIYNKRVAEDPLFRKKVEDAWARYCREVNDTDPVTILMPSHAAVAKRVVDAIVEAANE